MSFVTVWIKPVITALIVLSTSSNSQNPQKLLTMVFLGGVEMNVPHQYSRLSILDVFEAL